MLEIILELGFLSSKLRFSLYFQFDLHCKTKQKDSFFIVLPIKKHVDFFSFNTLSVTYIITGIDAFINRRFEKSTILILHFPQRTQ